MKKILSVLLAACLLCGLVGCGGARDEIVVAQREAGSGTRDAFETLFDCKDKVTGKLIYSTTGTLKTAVVADKMAIGYISLGGVDDTIKAVTVDGIVASEENILNKSYFANRPFMMISKKDVALNEGAADFMAYVYSNEGQNIVQKSSLIKAQIEDGATGLAYATAANSIGSASDKIKVKMSGSTSMRSVALALIENYNKIQPNVEFSTGFEGSGAGKTDVLKDDASRADIGLVSSALKEADYAKFTGYKVATDGIAIVVNKDNAINALTKEQVVKIFKGEIKNWSEVK